MRIAIVDDDPIVCQSLETILTATGTAGGCHVKRNTSDHPVSIAVVWLEVHRET